MTLKNMNSWEMETYNTCDLFRQWKEFKKENSSNHADNFKTEMVTIIIDTINKRNDFMITDYTPNEIARLIRKLTSK